MRRSVELIVGLLKKEQIQVNQGPRDKVQGVSARNIDFNLKIKMIAAHAVRANPNTKEHTA
jgi:hypothetical protein